MYMQVFCSTFLGLKRLESGRALTTFLHASYFLFGADKPKNNYLQDIHDTIERRWIMIIIVAVVWFHLGDLVKLYMF